MATPGPKFSDQKVFRLLYASRAAACTAVDPDGALNDILATACERNAAVGLSGLLALHDGWFIQALEGPGEAVRQTYNRILRDPRHDTIRLLSSEAMVPRLFQRWSMCAAQLSPADAEIVAMLGAKGPFRPDLLGPGPVLRLLRVIGTIHQRRFDEQLAQRQRLASAA